jgi:hypothetical protein
MDCAATPPVVGVTPSTVTVRKASFPSTQSIQIQGTSATVTCTPWVIDVNPVNPALDCGSSTSPLGCPSGYNPDYTEAHSPVGTLTWTLNGTALPTPQCVLQRVNWVDPQPPQQAPFASTCGPTSVPLAGSGAPEQLVVTLNSATHSDTQAGSNRVGVDVSFN